MCKKKKSCMIIGQQRSAQRRRWHPLQSSCMGDPRDRGAWWAAVHGVARSRARLSDFTFTLHSHALEKAVAPHSSTVVWEINGRGSLVGCSPWGRKELDTTERLYFYSSLSCIGEEMATHSSVLAWRIPGTGAWWAAAYGVAQSRT